MKGKRVLPSKTNDCNVSKPSQIPKLLKSFEIPSRCLSNPKWFRKLLVIRRVLRPPKKDIRFRVVFCLTLCGSVLLEFIKGFSAFVAWYFFIPSIFPMYPTVGLKGLGFLCSVGMLISRIKELIDGFSDYFWLSIGFALHWLSFWRRFYSQLYTQPFAIIRLGIKAESASYLWSIFCHKSVISSPLANIMLHV